MAFTDDDLKRFRNEHDEMPVEKIEALLTRLKAAEAFIEQLQSKECEESDLDKDKRLYDAWRKAAGR